jgi:hypothetical protein
MEADQVAPDRLHLLTGHDYTLRFVNHTTHVATKPLVIHATGRDCCAQTVEVRTLSRQKRSRKNVLSTVDKSRPESPLKRIYRAADRAWSLCPRSRRWT